MNIPLSFEHSDSSPDNPQELINMFVELDDSGAEAQYTVLGTPGLLEYKATGDARESRGGYLLEDGSLLTVIGDTVYKITAALVQTTIGTLSTNTGVVQFVENPTQVMLVDGHTTGYVFTIATDAFAVVVSTITPETITFQDTYGIASENEEERIYISGVNDFTTWDPLDFTTTEASPDPIVAVFSDHEEVWAFGTKLIEIYYNSGAAAFPFTRRQGAIIEIGCSARNSIAKGENLLFWLDDKGFVRKAEGYTPIIISTRKMERDIADNDWATAKAYSYAQEGHTFYVLIFADKCWTYDLSTQKWHKRYGLNEAWRASWIHQNGSQILAGDRINGKIYSLSTSTFTDDSNPIRWVATTGPMHEDRKKVKHRRLELHMETGLGDGQVVMDYTDDGGKTYSNEKAKNFGPIGRYLKRVLWRRLGTSRVRYYRFSGTSALKRKLISGNVRGQVIGSSP
jgi:hypothetical protein